MTASELYEKLADAGMREDGEDADLMADHFTLILLALQYHERLVEALEGVLGVIGAQTARAPACYERGHALLAEIDKEPTVMTTDKCTDLAERLRGLQRGAGSANPTEYGDNLNECLRENLPLILSALQDAARLEQVERLLADGWSLDNWQPQRAGVKFIRGDWDKDTGEATPEGKTLREALDAAREAGR